MERLQLPATFDEFVCEPVEQLGMRREFALEPEVTRRVDETAPHVVEPESVHENAGEKRMLAVRKPFCIGEAASTRA